MPILDSYLADDAVNENCVDLNLLQGTVQVVFDSDDLELLIVLDTLIGFDQLIGLVDNNRSPKHVSYLKCLRLRTRKDLAKERLLFYLYQTLIFNILGYLLHVLLEGKAKYVHIILIGKQGLHAKLELVSMLEGMIVNELCLIIVTFFQLLLHGFRHHIKLILEPG